MMLLMKLLESPPIYRKEVTHPEGSRFSEDPLNNKRLTMRWSTIDILTVILTMGI